MKVKFDTGTVFEQIFSTFYIKHNSTSLLFVSTQYMNNIRIYITRTSCTGLGLLYSYWSTRGS